MVISYRGIFLDNTANCRTIERRVKNYVDDRINFRNNMFHLREPIVFCTVTWEKEESLKAFFSES